MISRLMLLCLLLTCPADSAGPKPEVPEMRRAVRRFLDSLRNPTPPARVLAQFTPGAFDNPVTRQIVSFTGGSADDPPSQIRAYVLRAMSELGDQMQSGKCPDSEPVRDSIPSELIPLNEPVRDGYFLLPVDRQFVQLAGEYTPGERNNPLDWLRARLGKGKTLAAANFSCGGVPVSLLLEKQPDRSFRIAALAITGI